LRTPSDAEENFYLSGYIATTPDGTPFFARFNANRQFASEQLNGYETGYRRLFGRSMYVSFAGFYNRYHNLFDEEITGTPFTENNPAPTHLLLPAQFGNGLLGSTKGVEAAPEWKLTNFWQVRGTYSFLQMQVEKAPNSLDVGTARGIVGSSPRHQATVQSFFDLPKRLSLDLVYRYVAALPGPMVPSYSTADVRVAWRMSRQYELSLVGRNLFQPHHAEDGGDPGPLVGIRRSAYVKITWIR
jgi:iron complex outermembrane receptor protein